MESAASKPSSYRWLFLLLAITGLVIDLGSKYGIFRSLYNGSLVGKQEIWEGVFRLHVDYMPRLEEDPPCDCWFVKLNGPLPPRVNHGALFGLGGEHKHLANAFFAGISALAAVGILTWVLLGRINHDLILNIALGLILGGTIGNMYDRIVFGGVRDFLYFYLIDWPVFNFADCCLVCGAGLLMFHALRSPSTPAKQ